MIFKNLSFYRITKPLPVTAEQLSAAIADRPFVPCGAQDWARKGFVPPVDRSNEMTITIGNRHLVCLKIQEKILPAAGVKEALANKVAEIEQKENRIIGRKEKKTLKENVVDELLPRALTKSKLVFAYIDFDANLLAIDSSSSSVIDTLISSLRDALTTMPAIPLSTKQPAAITFAHWIQHQAPEGFTLRGACKLHDPLSGAKVTVADHDLSNEAFSNLLTEGHKVESIALAWTGECSFTLNKELRVTQFKFADRALMAGRDEDGEAASDVARADFILMHGLIGRLVGILIEECGGEEPIQAEEPGDAGTAEPALVVRAAVASVTEIISEGEDGNDPLYDSAVQVVRKHGRASISLVQRELRVGYNRAARLIERMEVDGVVSAVSSDNSRIVMLHEGAL